MDKTVSGNAESSSLSGRGSLLIATDFSESSTQATMHGLQTATQWGTTPHVVHVCEKSMDLLAIDFRGERMLLTPEKGQQLVAEHVDQLLQSYRNTYGEPGFGVAMSHIAVGDPADSIVKLAEELRVSMIVVGTSRKKGVERLLLGSTAERVVRRAGCAVLVSRPLEPSPEEAIEPPCPACVAERRSTGGAEVWCATHRQQHERRHTYHYRDKSSRVRGNLPLLFPMR
jgi:nucleotide-binding universal stress UspA family protein